MQVFRPGEGIDRYYEVMGYKNIDDQIKAETFKYVQLCERAASHNAHETEYRELAHIVFYHIQELKSTRKPSPLSWATPPISK